jgi:hypothetical protein
MNCPYFFVHCLRRRPEYEKATTWTGWWDLTDEAGGSHAPVVQRNNMRQFQRKLHTILKYTISISPCRISNFMNKKAQFNVPLK